MKFYAVSNEAIEIKKDNKLVDVTKDDVNAKLGATFGGDSKKVQYIFTNEEDAIKWATYGIADDATAHHAVLTLDSQITEEELKNLKFPRKADLPKVEDENGKKVYINAYRLPENRFTLVKASFAHADKDAKDVMFVDVPAQDEKPADKKDAAKSSSIVNFLKKAAAPVLTAGVAGTAFWYSGAVPAAVAALAKLGVALPAASLATQIAIPAAVGLATYAVGLAAWTLGKALVNGVSNAWKKFNRTNKEKYADDLAAETTAIKANETKLGLKEDSSFVVALDKMLTDAPEPAFDDKGAFAKEEPKAGNRLALAQWEREQLTKAVAANEADRPALLTEIRKGPKPTAK